jgi:hypothetical protein
MLDVRCRVIAWLDPSDFLSSEQPIRNAGKARLKASTRSRRFVTAPACPTSDSRGADL